MRASSLLRVVASECTLALHGLNWSEHVAPGIINPRVHLSSLYGGEGGDGVAVRPHAMPHDAARPLATALGAPSLEELDPAQRVLADRVLVWAREVIAAHTEVRAAGAPRHMRVLRPWAVRLRWQWQVCDTEGECIPCAVARRRHSKRCGRCSGARRVAAAFHALRPDSGTPCAAGTSRSSNSNKQEAT